MPVRSQDVDRSLPLPGLRVVRRDDGSAEVFIPKHPTLLAFGVAALLIGVCGLAVYVAAVVEAGTGKGSSVWAGPLGWAVALVLSSTAVILGALALMQTSWIAARGALVCRGRLRPTRYSQLQTYHGLVELVIDHATWGTGSEDELRLVSAEGITTIYGEVFTGGAVNERSEALEGEQPAGVTSPVDPRVLGLARYLASVTGLGLRVNERYIREPSD